MADDWKTMSEEQALSNRSILRVQQLSNELKKDLNALPLFAARTRTVGKVFFAAVDPAYKLNRERRRWYNFRLTNSYSFPLQVQEWLLDDLTRIDEFRPLFESPGREDRTTRASFAAFSDAVSNRDWSHAYDQFIVALAVIPYRGVLLSLFEDAFDSRILRTSQYAAHTTAPALCRFFSGTLDAMSLWRFDGFQFSKRRLFTKRQEELRLRNKDDKSLRPLFRIILPLTRGLEPAPTGDSPYPPEPGFAGISPIAASASSIKMAGFVVPACDAFTDGRWAGGMAGWMVALFESPLEEFSVSHNDTKDRRFTWHAFTNLMSTYVRRVREAHMFDLLEEYAELPDQPEPRLYFREHVHHLIGWKIASKNANASNLRTLKIPFEASEETLACPVVRLQDTNWDQEGFPESNTRLCKLFLTQLTLLKDARQLGEERGEEVEAANVHKTISHEFKKIVPLIEDAPRWVRRYIQHWLLGYTITGFSDFTQQNDGHKIPDALYGADTSNYAEWLRGLCSLTAEIEAIAIPGNYLHLPDSKRAWAGNCRVIESLFVIHPDLSRAFPPRDYAVRCLLGVAILCTLRNCVHHSTEYQEGTYVDTAGSPQDCYGTIIIKSAVGSVTCSLAAHPSDGCEWGNDLLITNPSYGLGSGRRGGSEGAIRFYLERLRERAKLKVRLFEYRHPNVPDRNGQHVCRLPSLAITKGGNS